MYAIGESIQPETGLLGATLLGVVLANIEVAGLQELRHFKESLTVFLVSGLFILLTANIDAQVLRSLSWPIALTTLIVVFVVRPLTIWLVTVGAEMNWRERLLVGWIGPRGVVAAAVAGIAGEQLAKAGYPDGRLILPMVFTVITSTVILHGLSLGPLARLLNLASKSTPGLLIVGASPWAIKLAEALRKTGVGAVLADRSWDALRPARRRGLPTRHVEILSRIEEEVIDLREVAYLLAATDDDAYNALVCTRFAPELGRERVHQLALHNDSEGQASNREWRGKIAIDTGLGYRRLMQLEGSGYQFTATKVEEAGRIPEIPGCKGWPVILVHATRTLAFFSPEQEHFVSPGDIVISFHRAQSQAWAAAG